MGLKRLISICDYVGVATRDGSCRSIYFIGLTTVISSSIYFIGLTTVISRFNCACLRLIGGSRSRRCSST
eukprot:1394437-Amorphochlora_amoeboformis.AAC.2